MKTPEEIIDTLQDVMGSQPVALPAPLVLAALQIEVLADIADTLRYINIHLESINSSIRG